MADELFERHEMRFKVGDIVTVIESSGTHPEAYQPGELYKVISILDTEGRIRTKNIKTNTLNGWVKGNFILAGNPEVVKILFGKA